MVTFYVLLTGTLEFSSLDRETKYCLEVSVCPTIFLPTLREPEEERVGLEDLVAAAEKQPAVSLTVCQVVRTKVFYQIWLGQFAISLSLVIPC